MKLIIAGSRGIVCPVTLRAAILWSGWRDQVTEVVSGMARGVDRLGVLWAEEQGLPVASFYARWKVFGHDAGFIRNEDMARYGDALLAVWDGASGGTSHMIRCAKDRGLPVRVYCERGL